MMENSHLMTTALLIRGRGGKGDTKIYDELSLESTSKSKSGWGGTFSVWFYRTEEVSQ